ncbi:S-layer homology domain-containing protein [Planococcus sp. CPCC 101016]|uniref:S-layer homology domain-containing protein n=1 Tax=Planococcus sp. CPCC 101016 TaxID=2599617 RepID=UPI0011B84884|nr:S-layer homology domain-containing protein [Planococcus sp. CPCC 101016]TWT07078.1 S-layer homology domain-containing protein [Planococcus sp. CPCC 101016]
MKKFMVPFVLLLSLFLVLPVAAAAPDLPEDHLFYEEITYLMEKGVVTGYPDGTVRPDVAVSRAEAAVMIARLKGLDGTKRATPFRDVPAGHYASGFVAAAAEAGYIKGYGDGTFRPNAPIIRGDMALIVERVFNLAFTFNSSFTDVPENAYYTGAISKILAANITIGYPDNTFRPRQEVTRGQYSAFLARALEPRFKNDAVIEDSYQKDKTKAYTYRMSDGTTAVHRFVDVPDRGGLSYGFMWTVEVDGDSYEYLELENHQLFAFGYPYSEYDVALVYPVRLGKTFNTGLGDETILHTITGVNKTVETEYKTFTNATEVTVQSGLKYYMAEGFSTIKSINAQGIVESELISVE